MPKCSELLILDWPVRYAHNEQLNRCSQWSGCWLCLTWLKLDFMFLKFYIFHFSVFWCMQLQECNFYFSPFQQFCKASNKFFSFHFCVNHFLFCFRLTFLQHSHQSQWGFDKSTNKIWHLNLNLVVKGLLFIGHRVEIIDWLFVFWQMW